MKGKAALVVGAAVGYVLGTRAGSERYEQIKARTNRLWRDPRVRERAAQAEDLAKEQAQELQERVVGASRKATAKAKDTTSHGEHTARATTVDERSPIQPGVA